jgi:hypothetical protein
MATVMRKDNFKTQFLSLELNIVRLYDLLILYEKNRSSELICRQEYD